MKIVFLSYPMSEDTISYGMVKGRVSLTRVHSMEQGDSSNSWQFLVFNHAGTHVDCPRHFINDGLAVCDYEAENWFFARPQIINLNLEPGQMVSYKDIENNIRHDADLLLLRSGWSALRCSDEYFLANPGLSPELARWLKRERPAIRAIGMDWISTTSYLHRDAGREAHRAFLSNEGAESPILLVEDMDLHMIEGELDSVWIVPLRLEGLDSAPCTVIGCLKD